MDKFLIDEEAARAQIEQFCDWYGIDLEENKQVAAEGGVIAFELTVRRLVKAFRRGALEVREEDDPKKGQTLVVLQRLAHPINRGEITEIEYAEITGATKASVKIPKNANDTAALYAVLAVLSGQGREVFTALRGTDIGDAELFGFLSMQV